MSKMPEKKESEGTFLEKLFLPFLIIIGLVLLLAIVTAIWNHYHPMPLPHLPDGVLPLLHAP